MFGCWSEAYANASQGAYHSRETTCFPVRWAHATFSVPCLLATTWVTCGLSPVVHCAPKRSAIIQTFSDLGFVHCNWITPLNNIVTPASTCEGTRRG